MGYARAGFEVVGVDIEPQPRYPYEFIQADALTFPLDDFDVVHASPPCQEFTAIKPMAVLSARRPLSYVNLIPQTRDRLIASGRLYVIENVPRAPLIQPVRLCGSSFGLPLRRHRLFESNVALLVPPCAHAALAKVWPVPLGDPRLRGSVTHRKHHLSRFVAVYGSTRYKGEDRDRRAAMGIDWMRRHELTQAIPPVYTELIGRQLLTALDRAA